MANYKTGAERYNDRMAKLMEHCRQLERENLERGGIPNPSLTDPETALKYGWIINGREVYKRDGLVPGSRHEATPEPSRTFSPVPDTL